MSIERVGAKSVDGFRWKRDQASTTEDRGGVGNGSTIGIAGVNDEDFGHVVNASYLSRAVS